MSNISQVLSLDGDKTQLTLQFSDQSFVPLGQQRLHTVELLSNAVLIQSELL